MPGCTSKCIPNRKTHYQTFQDLVAVRSVSAMKCTLVTVMVHQLGPGGLFGVARKMLSDEASGEVRHVPDHCNCAAVACRPLCLLLCGSAWVGPQTGSPGLQMKSAGHSMANKFHRVALLMSRLGKDIGRPDRLPEAHARRLSAGASVRLPRLKVHCHISIVNVAAETADALCQQLVHSHSFPCLLLFHLSTSMNITLLSKQLNHSE